MVSENVTSEAIIDRTVESAGLTQNKDDIFLLSAPNDILELGIDWAEIWLDVSSIALLLGIVVTRVFDWLVLLIKAVLGQACYQEAG